MQQGSHKHRRLTSGSGLVHLSQVLASIEWLAALRAEAELGVEQTGGFRGPVRREQRRWSTVLDQLENERQEMPQR